VLGGRFAGGLFKGEADHGLGDLGDVRLLAADAPDDNPVIAILSTSSI